MSDEDRDDVAAGLHAMELRARGMVQERSEVRARYHAVAELKRALEAFDGSATQLARAAGVSPSTITRPLKDPDAASLPKWATLLKILSAAGLKPSAYSGPISGPNSIRVVEVAGELRPGAWLEDADSRDYGPNLHIPTEMLQRSSALSAYVVGPEGIPYPPGTFAIVDQEMVPASGDFAVFRAIDATDKIETYAARMVIENGREVFYKIKVDGQPARSMTPPFSTTNPEMGVLVGTVVMTIWVRP